ncbi:hypothetical protein HDV62DRAFT_300869 [Trichoderma sp. SZMC 28011]
MAWKQSVPLPTRPIRGYILVSGAIPSLCICVQVMLVQTPVPGKSRSGSSSNRSNCYKQKRLRGDQPLGTVQSRNMTNIAIAFAMRPRTQQLSLFSTISTNSPA